MKKRAISIVLAVLLSISLFIVPASAAGVSGATTTSALNMRSGAGAEYDLLANVPRGTTLTVIGIATENSDWFKVSEM